jgi:hypothetical protein
MFCDFFTKYFRCCSKRENDTTTLSPTADVVDKKNIEWSGSWNSFPYTFDDMSKLNSTSSSSSSLSSLTSSSSDENEYRNKTGISHRVHLHNKSLFQPYPYDTR